MAGGKPFLNVVHVGLGSEISRGVDDDDERSWGRFGYLRRLFAPFERHRGFRARIRCGDEVRRGLWLEISIANGRSFGGGHEIAHATPCDGKLDVVAVRPRTLLQLLVTWLRMQAFRHTPADQAVVIMRGAEGEISRCKRLVIMADGAGSSHVPAKFGTRPAMLRVVVPSERRR